MSDCATKQTRSAPAEADPFMHCDANLVRLYGIESDRFTGAGMIERALALHLPEVLPAGWSVQVEFGSTSMVQRLFPGGDRTAAASVWVSTPLPVRRPAERHLHFVLDLRWTDTRSWPGRTYRRGDLHRIIKEADHIFTISEHVRSEIERFSHRSRSISVVPLGPGQVEGRPLVPIRNDRRIVLIGKAPHKRNEHLARLLAESDLVRREYAIDTIGVSEATIRTLEPLGRRVRHHEDVGSDQVGRILDEASVYAALTIDEGFGLPYVEAAYCGADVIAVDGTVAREIFRRDALYLSGPEPTVGELEQQLLAWEPQRIGRLRDRARGRSWLDAARHVAAHVVRVVESTR